MSFTEDDLLPLSALQHILFCERQCALIYIEQAWAENGRTRLLPPAGRRLWGVCKAVRKLMGN